MKKNFTSTVLFTLLSSFIYAQDYMDKIAESTCECVNKLPERLSNQKYTDGLGLCMLSASTPYEKKLKKDYGIDMKQIDTQGEELGRIIGMKMAGFCPGVIGRMASMLDENGEINTEDQFIELDGEITAISKEKFVEFTIKDENGKTAKYYWLSKIESEIDLENQYESLLNKKTSIRYTKQELFDSRINEYKSFNILTRLDQK